MKHRLNSRKQFFFFEAQNGPFKIIAGKWGDEYKLSNLWLSRFAAPTAERAAQPVSAEDSAFEASAAFAGARPGRVFKAGPQGVGYYSDPAQVHRCLVDPLGGRRLVKDGYPNFGMSVLGHIEDEVRK